MKTMTKIFSLLLVAILACSCHQENWLDWKLQNELWLAQNAKKDSVKTTPTGLQYKCIYSGVENNIRPDNAKIVTITYTGKLINGFVFDTTFDSETQEDEKKTMYVSQLVAGFAEGLKKMNRYGEYEFYIPYYLGYGEEGSGTEGSSRHIPPYSTLIFRVVLFDVY